MRIVIDLQACQGTARTQGIGRYLLAFAKSLANIAANHDVWLFLNVDFPEQAQEIRTEFSQKIASERILCWKPVIGHAATSSADDWIARANELLREHFLASLRPDFVIVANLFDCLEDGVVTSVGSIDSSAPTAVMLFDIQDLGRPDLEIGNEKLRRWFCRKVDSLKRADLILATSESAGRYAVETLGIAAEKVVTISASVDALLTSADERRFDSVAESALNAVVRAAMVPRSDSVANLAEKPRMAYVSPLPPLHTGIADYSSRLLLQLVRYYDIDLIVDQPSVELQEPLQTLPVRNCEWYHLHAHEFDYVLFHVGNSINHRYMLELLNTRSGVIVLHDFYLTGLLKGIEQCERDSTVFNDELCYSHGYQAVIETQKFKNPYAVWKYPCNLSLLESAEGLIVHSDYPRLLADKNYGSGISTNWSVVPHLKEATDRTRRNEVRQKLGLADDDILVCTFGFVCLEKLPDRIIEAWASSSLAQDPKCRFLFAGHNMSLELLAQIREVPSCDRISATGYLTTENYSDYLDACDFAIQLRDNSRGESSGATADCLGRGVPTIINAHGSFNDIPGNAVVKLDEFFSNEELTEAMERLRADKLLRAKLANAAHAYVREQLSPEIIGKKYKDAINVQTYLNPQARRRRIALDISRIDSQAKLTEEVLVDFASAIASQHPFYRVKQIFVDITVVHGDDPDSSLNTAVLTKLRAKLAVATTDYRVEPVYLDEQNIYRYARRFTMALLGLKTQLLDEPIEKRDYDSLLSLEEFELDGKTSPALIGV